MGLLHTHELIPQARKILNSKLYVSGGVVERPTNAAAGDGAQTGSLLSFTGGQIEFDGLKFSLNSLSLEFDGALATALRASTQYVVCAVPSYQEPADVNAAISLGLNYYVSKTPADEYVANIFFNPTLKASIEAQGGLANLTDVVLKGEPTAAQVALYNAYHEEIRKITDPRLVANPLKPVGVRLVLAQIYTQDNSSKADALEGKTVVEYNQLKSVVSEFPVERKELTRAEAITRYETGSRRHKIVRAIGYTSAQNRTDNVSPVNIDPAGATPFTTASAQTHVVVFETYYPSYMPLGQQGTKYGIRNVITMENVGILGRINPLYLESAWPSVRVAREPRTALTLYADPIPLVRLTTHATTKYPTSIVADYTMLIG